MRKQYKSKSIQAFTLVELSIVIVIIGLLVAGIASGANMVHQALLRSVITDLRNYQTAFNGFKARYNGAPGDITTGDTYWPSTSAKPCSVSGTACSGNGDGIIEYANELAGGPDELRPALRELAISGFISAGISTVPDTAVAMVPGVNAPTSKISGAGYFLIAANFDGAAGTRGVVNIVLLGKSDGTTVLGLLNGAMTSEDAFSIDQKIDDGTINAAGQFLGSLSGNFGSLDGQDVLAAGDCSDTTPTDANFNTYKISTTYPACVVGVVLGN